MLFGSPMGLYSFLNIICIFFNDTATTEIYTLSLHDALPIYPRPLGRAEDHVVLLGEVLELALVDLASAPEQPVAIDRKSTRLNSSHANISYAVFCLKKNRSFASLCFSALNGTHLQSL